MVLVGAVIFPDGSMAHDGNVNNPSEAARARQAQLSPAVQAKFRDVS